MASIASALARIKDNPLQLLDPKLVEQTCLKHNYHWRDRQLPPAETLACFMQQILHGNISCAEVRHLGTAMKPALSFSPQAYCQAKARVPLAVYNELVGAVHRSLLPTLSEADHLWHGHRTFHIDGSTFSMPDTPKLQKAFGMPSGPKPGCGFPVAHLLVLFSASTGILMDLWASPHNTSDLAQTPAAHDQLRPGDILLGDDTFSGYPHLAKLSKDGIHAVVPVHHLRIVDFKKGRPYCPEGSKAVKGMPRSRWVMSFGKEDQIVQYFKPKDKPPRMTEAEFDALPDWIAIRELRRTVRRPGLGKVTITLATTLLDPTVYPASELLDLRLRRWDVETNLGHLKTTMKMDILHCKTEEGVRRELAVFAMVYNLVRAVMLQAAQRQDVAVSRISFSDAYKWMRHAEPGASLPVLIVNLPRPNRAEPRCKKRRAKQYDLMNKPRDVLRKLLKTRLKAA